MKYIISHHACNIPCNRVVAVDYHKIRLSARDPKIVAMCRTDGLISFLIISLFSMNIQNLGSHTADLGLRRYGLFPQSCLRVLIY